MRRFTISTKLVVPAMITVFTMFAFLAWLAFRGATMIYLDEATHSIESIRASRSRYVETYLRLVRDSVVVGAESVRVENALQRMPRAFENFEQQASHSTRGNRDPRLDMRTFYESDIREQMSRSGIPWSGADRFLAIPPANIAIQDIYIAKNPYPFGAKESLLNAAPGTEYNSLHDTFHRAALGWIEMFGLYDTFLIDTKGNVVYTTKKEIDFGTNLRTGPFRNSALAEVFNRALRPDNLDETILQDYAPYEPSFGAPASFIGAPVFDKSTKELLGVFVVQVSLDAINETMTDQTGLGTTGETYIVGRDLLMRTDSRFSKETTILRQKVDNAGVHNGLNGQTGVVNELDYRGVPVISAYAPVDFEGLQWVILTEIDSAELMKPVRKLELALAVAFLACSAVCAGLLWLIMRTVVIRPVQKLAASAKNVEEGNFSGELKIRANDELGQLYRTFNRMVRSVNDQFAELRSGNTALGVVHTSLDGRFLRCNARFAEIIGYPLEDIPGMTIQDVTPPEDVTPSLEWLENLSDPASGPATFEKRYRRKDGNLVWVKLTITPREGTDGQSLYFMCIVEDIHALKTAQIRLDAANVALREAEDRYRAAFDTSMDSFSITRVSDGKFAEINKAFLSLFGFSREEVLGRNALELGLYPNPPDRDEMLRRLRAEGGYRNNELRFKRKNGDEFWMSFSATIFESNGTGWILSVCRDITESKASLQALQRAEQKYRTTFETSMDAMIISRLSDGLYLNVNPAAEGLLGFSRAELIGRTALELGIFKGPSDRERLMKALRRGGKARDLEFLMTRKDRQEIWILISASVFELDGIPTVLSILRDVSDAKAAQQALRVSEARYRTIFEKSVDAMSITRLSDSVYLDVNAASTETFGFTREEFLGRSATELGIFPDMRDRSSTREALLRDGEYRNIELGLSRKGGEKIWILLSSSLIEMDGTKCVLSIARDISAAKAAQAALDETQAQLLQSQKMEAIGQLAAGVAHDFNNILGVISGYSGLLEMHLTSDDTGMMYLQKIQQAGERAGPIIRQLLSFSRKQLLTPAVHDLNDVVIAIQDMLQRLLREDIHLKFVCEAKPSTVRVDEGQIGQVLMNLIVNGRDAMPNGGALTIHTATIGWGGVWDKIPPSLTPGAHVVLQVSDTGCGMDAATQQRIFEPFFTTKDKGKGTGLGLSTVFAIIQQCGGQIYVESELEKGTCFTMYFPLIEGTANSVPSPKRGFVQAASSETILLIEDDDSFRELLRISLRKDGYKVIEAPNGKTGVEIAREFHGHIDLLLTDVVMPELSGPNAAKEILQLHPSAKLLYISGYAEDLIEHWSGPEAEGPVLQKPFQVEDLLKSVRALLEKSS